MFGLSMHKCTISKINNHAEAVAFYESCKIKRGHDHGDERPISGKERSDMGVRITGNGAVHFRYHRTDVVSWYPDNSFRIQVWASGSTCEFATCFLPRGTYMTKTGTVLRHNDTYYPLVGHLVVHEDGRVKQSHEGTCFGITRIDRNKAKQALARTRYDEYRAWYNVMWPMVSKDGAAVATPYHWQAEKDYAGMLADDSRWHELMMSHVGAPDTLRRLIYRDANYVFYTEHADTLPVDTPWATFGKWRVLTR